jgi:hypothetical protein
MGSNYMKSVAYVEIDLEFYDIASERDRIYTYRYGQEGKTQADHQAKLLRPREGTRLSISDEEYSRIRQFVEARGVGSILVVAMKVSKVIYEDGTLWPQKVEIDGRRINAVE